MHAIAKNALSAAPEFDASITPLKEICDLSRRSQNCERMLAAHSQGPAARQFRAAVRTLSAIVYRGRRGSIPSAADDMLKASAPLRRFCLTKYGGGPGPNIQEADKVDGEG